MVRMPEINTQLNMAESQHTPEKQLRGPESKEGRGKICFLILIASLERD